MEVSVIVTNFNYEQFIGRCIRSLLNQTLPKSQYEIVFVDDGSLDQSLNVARSFGEAIKLIEIKRNLGLASASNIGFRNCEGRLIVRVDSDDFVHPNFLATFVLANELLGGEFDAFSCDYYEVNEKEQVLRRVSSQLEPIACGIAFKQEILLTLGAYKDGMRIWEDKELLSRFNSSGKKLHNSALPLYRYVKHPNSLTASISPL